MADARTEILERIRSSLGRTEGTDTDDASAGPVPRRSGTDAQTVPSYRTEGTTSGEELIALFVDRLEDYDATVERVPTAEIGAAIARFLGDATRIVVPAALPAEWLSPFEADAEGRSEREVLRDERERPLDTDTLDGVDAVVTGSAVSVADTGTIVLAGALSGRRATTLVPDHHVVVVKAADIVELVPEAVRAIVAAGLDASPITMVSGPSATVDIEFIRVRGVHGPRTLDVVIAE